MRKMEGNSPEIFWEIVNRIESSEKLTLKNELLKSLECSDNEQLLAMPFETLSFYINVRICGWDYTAPIMAYGAGKMAKQYIPQISDYTKVLGILDAYSKKENIYGINIMSPDTYKVDINVPIVIFIDDKSIRKEVISKFRKDKYRNLFYFRDYIRIMEDLRVLDSIEIRITDKTTEFISDLNMEYAYLDSCFSEVLFATYKKANIGNELSIDDINTEVLASNIIESLEKGKVNAEELGHALSIINRTIKKCSELELACILEELLGVILHSGIKTRKRPIRMSGDRPYDSFAVFSVLQLVVEEIFSDDEEKCIQFLEYLYTLSNQNIYIIAVLGYFYLKFHKYEKALDITRKAVVIDSNDLLANECFYHAAVACKKNGIYVEEPIPEYDLSEKFCWSGISFAWCGGMDQQSGKAQFGPCFRPLQCAARPEGEFWTSDEWKEFRKSVIDGSFRYCQKNQCPNIVSGWLPKKNHVTNEKLKRLVEGDISIIPELSELHFSYDGHCNLKCPSCRTEYRTNTKELNEKFDNFYENELKPYVKKVNHLCLSGCGEALLSPHSRKILDNLSPAEYPNLEVELRTNMTVLNEKTWNALGEGRKCIKHIAASIDSCTKENFEKIRFPAKWDVVYDNLKFVQRLRKTNEIEMFEFHVVIQKDNVEELTDIVKLAISLDADCVTFSRLINWRDMTEEEYHDVNPFWHDSLVHGKLLEQWEALIRFREDIESGKCKEVKKKFYINLHFVSDPNESYDEIREGRIRIR